LSAGSHATFGGWEPKLCERCGERVTISGRNARGAIFRFDVATQTGRSWHADCRPRVVVKVKR
jgi:hypothetical protein